MPTMAHLTRFATRWRTLRAFGKEKMTLVLSPHLDDIFLSLYATLVAGKLGKNIIGVNFFTSGDSSVDTKSDTTFATVTAVSLMRMQEELAFSRMLLSRGINYLPIFLGLKETSIDRYYSFIASAVMARMHKRLGSKTPAPAFYQKLARKHSNKIEAATALRPLLKQFGASIERVLAPVSIGMNNLDHGIVAQTALQSFESGSFGLYAEVPYVYLSGNMSIDKIRARVPRGFGEVMVTKTNTKEKAALFKKIYKSQNDGRMQRMILASGSVGEVIFWRK